MKRALSLMLIALTVPVDAQPATDTFDLARTITREAERFANHHPALPAVGNLQTPTSDRSDWSRVGTLASGTQVIVTVQGVKYSSRYMVTADDVQLVVLNIVDPTLPYDLRRALFGLARRQPAYFATPQPPEVFVEGNVRLDPDGVFVSGRKVTTLERVVERFARDQVNEVSAEGGRASTFMGNFGGLFAIGAAVAGAIGGGMLGHRHFARYKPLGAVLGTFGGLYAGVATGVGILALGGAFQQDVIYRAP